LLATWFAFIAADRIDLLGGAASFRLTPFLLLTPIVAASELTRRWRQRRPVKVPTGIVVYAALISLFLSLSAASSVLAIRVDTSAPRVLLLVAQVAATLAVALLAADRPDLLRVLSIGAMLVLPMHLVADAAELQWFIGRGPELWRLGTVTVHFDELQLLGLVPRFPGLVGDANRAGYVLAIYWSVIARGEPRPWRRRAALGLTTLLILGTFSRSTLLAILAATIVGLVTRTAPPTAKVAAGLMLLLTLGLGIMLVSPGVQTAVVDGAGRVLESRVSTNEGSARSHIALIQRGVAEGSESIPRGLIGLGYGNAYLVLQDFFPGNRYGNFHSLYVTAFAEMGIFGLLVTLVLVFTPVFVGGSWRPLAAGAVTFNLFYQTTSEPAFWFVLAMAWLTLATKESESKDLGESRVDPSAAPIVAL
jgi:hypothetical protein